MTPPAEFGLFGKLPWEGDFILRGLPGRFVRPWDEWLSRALAASRESMGGAWADAYLLSPPWHFSIEPGVIGPTGWAGVLVTSIDRVRRYFPLTLALELQADETNFPSASDLKPVLGTLEAAALRLIANEQSLDAILSQTGRQVEAAFAALASGRPQRFVWDADGQSPASATERTIGDDAPWPTPDGDDDGPSGSSSWWHDRWNAHAPASVRCRGLPSSAAFAAFLDGQWEQHGWRRAGEGARP